jgi:putative SOS response-associated peptidase YedK
MINARAETLAKRPAFRTALQRRRCLVVADGFYEWASVGNHRIPMRVTLKSGEPFAFAGLWERWKAPSGEDILSCTIITTGPNDVMQPVHDRMPVILSREAESLWLEADVQDTDALTRLLVPFSAEEMDAYEVSPLVNSPRNDVPGCIARVV